MKWTMTSSLAPRSWMTLVQRRAEFRDRVELGEFSWDSRLGRCHRDAGITNLVVSTTRERGKSVHILFDQLTVCYNTLLHPPMSGSDYDSDQEDKAKVCTCTHALDVVLLTKYMKTFLSLCCFQCVVCSGLWPQNTKPLNPVEE